jgi:hypothetical protein
MSLTLRHLLLSATAVGAALTASLVTLPNASHQLAAAHLTLAQAAAVQALPPAGPQQRRALASLRDQLPVTLTSEQAHAALADLAERHSLTWTTLTAGEPVASSQETGVGPVTLTSIELSAHLTGPRSAVTQLLTDLPAARPLLTVRTLHLSDDGDGQQSLDLTVTAHAAAGPR